MLFTPTTYKVPMMNGQAVERDGLSFMVPSNAGMYRLAVSKCGKESCIVSDYRTGLKVSHEYTGDMKEAALGFADMLAVKAVDIHKVIDGARSFPTINDPIY